MFLLSYNKIPFDIWRRYVNSECEGLNLEVNALRQDKKMLSKIVNTGWGI